MVDPESAAFNHARCPEIEGHADAERGGFLSRISTLEAQLEASERERDEARLLVHNCTLALPAGQFLRDVEKWLEALPTPTAEEKSSG